MGRPEGVATAYSVIGVLLYAIVAGGGVKTITCGDVPAVATAAPVNVTEAEDTFAALAAVRVEVAVCVPVALLDGE